METLIHKVLPTILTFGITAFGIKYYLHFKYFKIVKKYPKGLTFWDFNNSILTYFIDQLSAFFPFFVKSKTIELNMEDLGKAKKLEKLIKLCLILIYIGLLMIPLGIKLQGV